MGFARVAAQVGVFAVAGATAHAQQAGVVDKTWIQSRYDATQNGGTITIPNGQWPPGGYGAPFSPTKSVPGKTVLWNFTGPAPSGAVGDGDVTESFAGGHANFLRNVFTGNTGNPTLFVTLDNYSRGYKTIHYNGSWVGEFADVPALQVNATTHPNSLGQVNGVEVFLNSLGNNAAASEDQGLDVKVTKAGQNSTWAISTMTNDTTGLPPQAFASIAGEYDLLANGPDDPASLYDPEKGNRIFMWLVGKVSPVPHWAAQKRYAAGDRVLADASVFIATHSGTSGGAAPAWPSAGTVPDGGVTWRYGEPYAVSFGRGIALDAQAGQAVSFSTGFSSNAAFANAVLDLSAARLLRPQAAGLRLAANMPVDFSATASAAGQNRHTLEYSTAAGGLVYAIANRPALTIRDGGVIFSGHVAVTGAAPTLTACGAGAALSATASDRHGTVTTSAGSCTITFSTAYTTVPDCLLTGFSSTPPYILAVSATRLAVQSAGKFTYLCEQ